MILRFFNYVAHLLGCRRSQPQGHSIISGAMSNEDIERALKKEKR